MMYKTIDERKPTDLYAQSNEHKTDEGFIHDKVNRMFTIQYNDFLHKKIQPT